MLLERCPKCNAKVGPTDTQCLDCGEDLLKHMEELRKAATSRRELTTKEKIERAQKAAHAAARGRAFGVERSEETRMRTFDQHDAELTRHEMITAWATVVIAVIVALVAMKLGGDQVKAGGGADGLREVTMPQLREWGFGMIAKPAVQGLMALGIALGSLLCVVGQTWRALRAHQSIAAVARGEKPALVALHATTRAGMIVIGAACPPAGILFGILLKVLGRDEDTKSLGTSMLLAAVTILLILGLNMLWGLASNLKPAAEPPGASQVGDETSWLPWAARWFG